MTITNQSKAFLIGKRGKIAAKQTKPKEKQASPHFIKMTSETFLVGWLMPLLFAFDVNDTCIHV